MSEKKLFVKVPWITTFPTQSYFVACDAQGISDYWFFEFSLNLFASFNPSSTSRCGKIDFFSPEPFRACPWIKHQEIWYELLWNLNIDFVDFVIHAINEDYYVISKLDRFYIDCAPEYLNNHFQHDVFIYGYDTDKQQLYFADFFPQFGLFSMSFQSARNAFSNLNLQKLLRENMVLMKPSVQHIDGVYSFRKKRAIHQLSEYVKGTTSYEGYSDLKVSAYEINRDGFMFGINTYDYLKSYIETQISISHQTADQIGFVEWDHRGVHTHYMHKLLVKRFLNYLIEKEDESSEINYIAKQYDNVIAKAFSIRNSFLKAQIKRAPCDLVPTIEKINELKVLELKILEQVVKVG